MTSSRNKPEQGKDEDTYTINEREQVGYERYREGNSKTDSLEGAEQTFYEAARTDTLSGVTNFGNGPKNGREVKINTGESLQKRLKCVGTLRGTVNHTYHRHTEKKKEDSSYKFHCYNLEKKRIAATRRPAVKRAKARFFML